MEEKQFRGIMDYIRSSEPTDPKEYVSGSLTLEDINDMFKSLSYTRPPAPFRVGIYSVQTFKSYCRKFGGYYSFMDTDWTIDTTIPVFTFMNRYERIYPRKN